MPRPHLDILIWRSTGMSCILGAASTAEVQGRAHRPAPRSEPRRRRRLETLEELEVLVEPDVSRRPGLPQSRHVAGRGRQVAIEREAVSRAA